MRKIKVSSYIKNIIELKEAYKYFYTFSVIETGILTFISVFQFIYIKRLLEVKASF
jgi:hypothetical protein